jgi:hypothetical protein
MSTINDTAEITVVHDDRQVVHRVAGSSEAARAADIQRTIKKALRAGHTVVYPNGVRVYHERVVRFNPKAETSSARYEWSEDGNKVRADIVEHTIHPDGTEDTRTVREVWVKY